jgi:hypothetical protein
MLSPQNMINNEMNSIFSEFSKYKLVYNQRPENKFYKINLKPKIVVKGLNWFRICAIAGRLIRTGEISIASLAFSYRGQFKI